MKINLLFVVFTLFVISAEAEHRHSAMELRMYDQALFIATLDNVCNETPSRILTFDDLNPGSHHLFATRVRLNRWGHIIHKEVVFDGLIRIPKGSKVDAVISRHGHFRIINIFPVNPVVGQQPFYNPYHASVICGPAAMSDLDFRILLESIEHASFDRTRLNIALFALERNHFTSVQIAMLMSLMTFESTKLTLAKQAFDRTVDPEVYYAVYEQFTFESSIRELNDFIGWG